MRQAITRIEGVPGGLTKAGWKLPEGLTFEQWSEAGAKLAAVHGAVAWWVGDWYNYGERKYGEKAAAAKCIGDGFGLEASTVQNYAFVADRLEFSRRRENLTFGHHQSAAGEEDPQEWLARAEKNDWSVAELRESLKRDRLRKRFKAMAVESIEARKYPVILADPPWQYDFSPTDSRKIENQYPTMSLDEIKALGAVERAANDDAILFLWGTSPKLIEALEVIAAWGFTYRTGMVWVKDQIGMGHWTRQRHEPLLIATRGEPPTPLPDARPDSVIEAPRGRHSEKPTILYELIEAMFPGLPKLELFARTRRDGWDAWGNE